MKRGEVWWVEYKKTRGSEIQKTRPSIIVSNDASNRFLDRVQVIPVSSNVSKLYPSESYVRFAGKQHKAMADQIATASKDRLKNKIAMLSERDMHGIEKALKIQLGL